MPIFDRTLSVPITGYPSNTDFTFPPKYPNEILDYVLDLRAWIAVNDLTLTSCLVTVSDSLVVINQTFMVRNSLNVGVQIELSGGNPGVTETILFKLRFAQGDVVDIIANLPVATLPSGLQQPALPGILSVGGVNLSVGGVLLAGFTNS